MSDLIVYDEEYSNLESAYDQLGTLFATQLNDYLTILGRLNTDAVTSGNVHDNLVLFYDKVAVLKDLLDDTLDVAGDLCDDYVDEVDDKDKGLYD